MPCPAKNWAQLQTSLLRAGSLRQDAKSGPKDTAIDDDDDDYDDADDSIGGDYYYYGYDIVHHNRAYPQE